MCRRLIKQAALRNCIFSTKNWMITLFQTSQRSHPCVVNGYKSQTILYIYIYIYVIFVLQIIYTTPHHICAYCPGQERNSNQIPARSWWHSPTDKPSKRTANSNTSFAIPYGTILPHRRNHSMNHCYAFGCIVCLPQALAWLRATNCIFHYTSNRRDI